MADEDYSTEEWRPIPGWEGLYEASSLGRIKSLARSVLMTHRGRNFYVEYPGKLLTNRPSKNGYVAVSLSRDGRSFVRHAHRLVCEAFNGAPPEGLDCAHLNGVRNDNRAANLIWATRKENSGHRWLHGTMLVGEGVASSKLTSRDVAEIRERAGRGEKMIDIAAAFGINKATVSTIVAGRVWRSVPMIAPKPPKRPGNWGQEHSHAKLTPESVRAIRAKRAAGVGIDALMAEFGVSRGAVKDVVQRRTWRHLD